MATKLETVGRWYPPKWVNVDELIIDDADNKTDYQRTQRAQFPRWDWRLYDPIRVAVRSDGTKHVPDGGHRVRQARRFGITRLPALFSESSGAQTEANQFMAVQRARRGLSTFDRYKAALVAKEEWAMNIATCLRKHGLHVGKRTGWPNVRVVAALKDRPTAALDFACDMILRLWDGDSEALTEPILRGLIDFWIARDGDVDADRLETRLKRYPARSVIQQCNILANGGERRFAAYRQTFENNYNRRR